MLTTNGTRPVAVVSEGDRPDWSGDERHREGGERGNCAGSRTQRREENLREDQRSSRAVDEEIIELDGGLNPTQLATATRRIPAPASTAPSVLFIRFTRVRTPSR